MVWCLARYITMDPEPNRRLPLTHPQRIKARDLKLQRRDEERANRSELTRYRCPCNLCGGRRRPYKSATVARHLRHRGRHGALRGWTQVTISPQHGWEGGSRKWSCTMQGFCEYYSMNMFINPFNFWFRVMTTTPRTRSGRSTLADMQEHFSASSSQCLR